jgi:hypothetical protein
MMPKSPNGRTNVGTVSLDGNELKFDADDSLNIHMSHEPPADADTHELACRCRRTSLR